MDIRGSCHCWKWQVAFSLLLCSWGWVSGQLHYSIVEESDPGTVVGNVAQDLSLKSVDLFHRNLRLDSKDSKYFILKPENGLLLVNSRLDRENLCGSSLTCTLNLEVVVQNPLELFSLEIKILDINDNSPSFSASDHVIKISEAFTNPGARYALEIAEDLDIGVNDVAQYILSTSPYFSLSVKNRKDGTLIPQLILEKVLDREEKQEHNLILTAIDGGEPARSGSCHITIKVLDINDNPPVFNQSVYKINLKENPPLNKVILKLVAKDVDEGINGDIEYSFDSHTSKYARKLFELNEQTGEIYISGVIDYEELNFYELSIRAVDKGVPELEGDCLIQIEIEDENDNYPEMSFSSVNNEIPENTPLGTIVGFINVNDKDSGKNGEIILDISPHLPFKTITNTNRYSLVTDGILDREKISEYTIELTATDLGSPPLSSKTTVILRVSDVNDNAPTFTQSTY
ncbi:protocadherin gamma-C5-like [Pyxicephalus adspersus]|uniref:protocadherin gamma-C5-like n=1 Tax=Pyxicephalus adspersus TaxID=30357 RepID=UPI003B5AEE6B